MQIAFTSLVGLLLAVVAQALPAVLLLANTGIGRARLPPVRHLTTADGLSGNTVRCIAQDEQGFMRLGTQDGLSRYDGSSTRPLPAAARRQAVASTQAFYPAEWIPPGTVEAGSLLYFAFPQRASPPAWVDLWGRQCAAQWPALSPQ